MQCWKVGNISVRITLGNPSNEEIDLAVTSEGITLGFDPSDPFGKRTPAKISIKEDAPAKHVIHWPQVSVLDENRREIIYNTVKKALESAHKEQMQKIGFYIFSLEVARIPSWEVAEEIVRALQNTSNEHSSVDSVIIVTSSAVQMSSLQFALENQNLVTYKND